MFERYRHIPLILGALIALVLQILLAPNIALGYAMPNFVVGFAVAYAITAPNRISPVVTAFVLGLLYNLFCGGVVGGMACALTLACFVLSRLFEMLDTESFLTAFLGIVVAVLAVEVIYGIIALLCGVQGGILDAFVYRALPCALYDCIVGLIMYPLIKRFVTADVGPAGIGSVHLR